MTVSVKTRIDGRWVSVAGAPSYEFMVETPFSFCVVDQTTIPQTVDSYLNVSKIEDSGGGKTKITFLLESEGDGYAVITQGDGAQDSSGWRIFPYVNQSDCFSTHLTVLNRPLSPNKAFQDSHRISVQVFSKGIKDA